MHFRFTRIAIVNRGEPAMRLIHAVREMNAEHRCGLKTIALYTEPDFNSMFVREADEAFCIGPATFIDPRDNSSKSTYLDPACLRRALLEVHAEAAWVGWGFVAERAEFVDLCEELGIVFIGPSGEVMRVLGDKIASKKLAESADVLVAPWSGGPVTTVEEARAVADRIGYPVLIKASAGGGGRGIRKARNAGQLEALFDGAGAEALKAFGDATVFIEKVVENARHVEVQILADSHGTTWAVGVRDCALQRRNQKVVEEAPSPALPADVSRGLCEAAARIARAAGYVNAGTVEFLFDVRAGRYYFMEMNTRLQVEHPVTEITTGLDLVKCQLYVADGRRLEGAPPAAEGHAIEVRINAEDPDNGFAPAPGVVELLRLPTGPGLRVDTGVAQGDTIASDFDSMIAKLIAHGRTREEALGRLECALAELVVVIDGGRSNKAFLLELLQHEDVQKSRIDIGWLDRTWDDSGTRIRRHAGVALAHVAIEMYDRALEVEKQAFLASAARERIALRDEDGISVELGHAGQAYQFQVYQVGPRRYRLEIDGHRFDVQVDRMNRFERRVRIAGRSFRVVTSLQGTSFLVEVNGTYHRVSSEESGAVLAPGPGVVLSLQVKAGDEVEAGQALLVMEAMKMETVVSAPFSGRVRDVAVGPGIHVAAGSRLLMLEPLGDGNGQSGTERVSFETLEPHPQAPEPIPGDMARLGERVFCELKHLVMGYEVPVAEVETLVAEWLEPGPGRSVDDAPSAPRRTPWHRLANGCSGDVGQDLPEAMKRLLERENEILSIFADVIDLFERRPNRSAEQGLSRRECLLAFIQSMDPTDERLPRAFATRMERVLRHYGIERIQRGPALAEALLWLHKSYRNIGRHRAFILKLIEARIESVDVLAPLFGKSFKDLLDRLIDATQDNFPGLNQMARLVHYRYFEAQRLERSRAKVFEIMTTRLDMLSADPDRFDREQELASLANQPQPIGQFLLTRLMVESQPKRALFYEVLVRRMYRTRRVEGVRHRSVKGTAFTVARFSMNRRDTCTVGAYVPLEQLRQALAGVAALAARHTGDSEDGPPPDLLVDHLVIAWRETYPDEDTMAATLARHLDRVQWTNRPRRIAFNVLDTAGDTVARHFTFVPGSRGGFREVHRYRGIHPAHGDRLELWRLENFKLLRLPSPEDCYLYLGTARDNPTDQRLFALVEVHELIPFRDESGKLVRVPHIERRTLQALDAMRDYMFRHPDTRLDWNRLTLFITPQLDMSLEEMELLLPEMAPILARPTQHLGVDRVAVHAWVVDPRTGVRIEKVMHTTLDRGRILRLRISDPGSYPISTLTPYKKRVMKLRRRGLAYPYEIIKIMTPTVGGSLAMIPHGTFVEHDLDGQGRLVPVQRSYGENQANVVVGIITNYPPKFPEGMSRVVILGDPSRGMGSLAEPECVRIIQAIDMAEERGIPVEWFAISSGARIAMDSGTENLDWTARVLRRIVEFTQAGGEINVVVDGINVGAQSYWNAEATMLMHTRGILIMTHNGAMVLTGKRALEYSGSVSAEDHQGIGGAERIMGPNGEAQYLVTDIAQACQLLFHHYYFTYVAPGERFPRPALVSDPRDRDVTLAPLGHQGNDDNGFTRIGDIFSAGKNPGRKKPFPIRAVMHAVIDRGQRPLERWALMRSAETAVVWDAQIGGYAVCLIGIESRNIPRVGYIPGDGPDTWSGGTLFPRSSKKVARAINASSGNRPVVLLANLSGFDGSPESMRRLQLEHGAEIGRAVVNFDGPIVFCVISRYHGGAYVVFSRTLNENLKVAALEGSFASVIGGAPAAAVVFPNEVKARTRADPRVKEIQERLASASESEKAHLNAELAERYALVYAEKLTEVAESFEAVHSVARAKQVGSLHDIIAPSNLRPYLIEAIEQGMQKAFPGVRLNPA